MSETPRTDRARLDEHDPAVAVASECSKLEGELNAGNKRISKLYDYVAALETGGDLMAYELSFGYEVDLWNKARGEAKP